MAAFISVWSVPFGGSDESRTVILPIISGTILNDVTVDWGDNSNNNYNFEVTNANRPSRIYATGGEKTITITGTGPLGGWSFGGGLGTPTLLKSITQYGNLQLANTGSQFLNCTNLVTFPQTGTLILPANCFSMFNGCIKLDTHLNTLDTTGVITMIAMFNGCSVFDGDISDWNVLRVQNMSNMFSNCSKFTGTNIFDLPVLVVNDVTAMSLMFSGCTLFNGNISNWNVSTVTEMIDIFSGCDAFRTDISQWVLTGITFNQVPTFSPEYIDEVKPLFSAEYPNAWKFNVNNFNDTDIIDVLIPLIPGNDQQNLYTTRQVTEGTDTFIILERNPFVTTWTVTDATTITLPISIDANTNIRVDWGQGAGFVEVNTGERPTQTYVQRADPYFIRILGRINGWSYDNITETISRRYLTSIESYGCLLDIGNTGSQFTFCLNLKELPQTGTLTLPSNCRFMFTNCRALTNADLNNMDTTNVTLMNNMFSECTSLVDCNISDWNVQGVLDMTDMFLSCGQFTGANIFDLNEGSAVRNMQGMFNGCNNFNGDISNWDVSKVRNMSNIFLGCNAFKQDISKWVLTGITTNLGAPTFSTVYIDEVRPKFSSEYPASWKFTASAAVDKNIINTILPAGRKNRYYIDNNLRLLIVEKDASVSAITGSGNSSIKYAYNSRIKVFF